MMPWDVTKQPGFQDILIKQYLVKLDNLRYRSSQLSAQLHKDAVIDEFTTQAPVWAKHGKSFERVESFLGELQGRKRYSEHKKCFMVWAHELSKNQLNIHEFVSHKNQIIRKDRLPNPEFVSSDEFSVLNAYLALDPIACLSGSRKLLAKSWIAAAKTPDARDSAVIAIFAGLQRFVGFHQKFSHETNYSISKESRAAEYFRLLASSCGVEMRKFIKDLPVVDGKPSAAMNKYYSKLVDLALSYGGSALQIPRVVSDTRLVHSKEIVDLFFKVNLGVSSAHSRYMSATTNQSPDRFSGDAEQYHYNNLIANKYATASQIYKCTVSYSISHDNFQLMIGHGYAADYVRLLKQEEREHLIKNEVIPKDFLEKPRDRAILFTTELGV